MWRWLALLVLCGACSRDKSPTPPAAEAAPAPLGTATASAPRVPPPIYDLAANLSSCLVEHRGISIDTGTRAAEARRGFAIAPFEDVAAVDRQGASFSRLLSRKISYEFWLDEALDGVLVALRVHGGTARGVTASIGDRRVGSAKLTSGETRIVTFHAQKLELSSGQHTLVLRFWGGERGGKDKAVAELDWIRIGPKDELEATYAAPTLRDLVTDVVLDGQPRRSIVLRGPGKVRCPLRPAKNARLRVALGYWGAGRGVADLRIVRDGEPPVTLEQRKVGGGAGATWTALEIDLGRYASQVIGLELRALETTRGGRIAFGDAAIVRGDHPEATVPEAKVVVLVVAAGLDRRRIPPWGPTGQLTALGELSRSAAAFSRYRVPTTVSAGVMASLLTGMPPASHALEDHAARLPPSVRTIAEIVKEASGRTAMLTGVPTTFAAFGFDTGWDRFEAFSPVHDISATEPLTRAAAWLEAELDGDDEARRLVVVHTRGAHPPWDLSREELSKLKPEEYGGALDARRGGITLGNVRSRPRAAQRRLDDEDWVRLHALHDAALAKQNQGLLQVMNVLKRAGLWKDTLFLFTGDVALGEPPEVPFGPAPDLAEDKLIVPLLVKFPGNHHAEEEILAAASSVDIAHTILQALRLKIPEQVVGADLFALASGSEPLIGRPMLATLGNQYSTRFGRWLLTGELARAPRLCRLDIDPACAEDVLGRMNVAAQATWQWTYDALTAGRAPDRRAAREPASVDPETAAALVVWGDLN